ncbi:DUF58 domain-containing protein [Clostridium oryzae]|uniref:DUF58 domain-containing protein n=1 Tax=Clostridium oryzae TaxID=1450648 RepID=A0A1V4IST5_9CLOT|nr:DUF58 domain-containing protein [Clostridium oryzae]OPJ63072.1 hypothetical protein CLORY_14380 [Clostridium oryzae]
MNEKIFDSSFFSKLENISIKTRMAMTQGTAGGRKSNVKGNSVEFSDFREYTPGDDFRRVDWNAYGRFNKLFLKLFMEEREALLNIFIDCSKSMDYGINKKAVMAMRISGVLTYSALSNLDRVIINKVNDNNIIQSSSYMGKGRFQETLQFIEKTDYRGSTNLSGAIKKKNFTGRGISVIISDFFTSGSIINAIKYLAYKKQHIIFIQVLSREELMPELNGPVRLVDIESGEDINIIITPKLLDRYKENLKTMRSSIKEQLSSYGGSFIQVTSDEELDKIVFEDLSREGII